CAREVRVVGIQVGDNGAARAPPSLVDGSGLAAVGLGHPRKAVTVLLQDRHGFVRRPTVHDQVLDPRIALGEHAVDRLADESPLIERRRDDADERLAVAQLSLPGAGTGPSVLTISWPFGPRATNRERRTLSVR